MFALCKHAGMMNTPNPLFQAYLTHAKVKQSDVATAVNVTRGHMSSLTAGLKKPSLKVAAEIEKLSGGLVPAASWFNTQPSSGSVL